MAEKWSTRKKKILALAVAAVLLLLPAGGILLSRSRQTTVAFFGISEGYANAFQDLAVQEEAYAGVNWLTLSEEDVLSPRIHRKVDLLITYTGALTDSLALKTLPLPEQIASRYPRSIQRSPVFSAASEGQEAEFRVMPILLNHYEAAYFEVFQRRTGLSWPKTLKELESYARACLQWVDTPMICAGENDENLYLLISLLAESLAGADGYLQLVSDLRSLENKDNLDEVLDIPLKGKAPEGSSFRTLLDFIKGWQQEGLLLPDWYEASERLVTVFMEDNHAAVVFMSLEEHRSKPFLTIKYFQANPFPPEKGIKETTVEPAISALCFDKTELTDGLLNLFSSEKGQEVLSAATRLAPAALKGAAVDIQADDARYFAAASKGGPVPDLGRAVYLRESERALMAEEIRGYLSRP